MSEETAAVADKEQVVDSNVSAKILVFELEGAALDGRAKLFEAVKSVFKDAGVKLTDTQFARVCTQSAVPAIVDALIADNGGDKVDGDALDKTLKAYTDSFSKKIHVHPLFTAVIEEAKKRGMDAFALTSLPEDVANAALEASGLAKHNVKLEVFPADERHFPRADCWMKVGHNVGRQPHNCVAVAGSHDSARAALSAGMHSIVVPDQYTSYQDFSGTDAVLEDAEDINLKDLFDAFE